MRALSATFLLGATMVCATPSLAQNLEDDPILEAEQQVGTRFLLEPETAEQQEARNLQKRVANCVWNRHEDQVRELLINSDFYQIHFDDIEVGSDTFGEDLDIDYCIGRAMRGRYRHLGMRYQYASMRNLLAEEAYLGDFGSPPVIEPAVERRTPNRFEGRNPHPQVTGMAGLADCIVYGAPQQAHDLLSARPGSEAETAAVSSLSASFIACSGGNDAEVSVSTSMLRQMVADGLWARSTYGQGTPRASVAILATEETASANNSTLEAELARCIFDADPAIGDALIAATERAEFEAVLSQVLTVCQITGSINVQEVQSELGKLRAQGEV